MIRIEITGNLGKDAVVRDGKNGSKFLSFSVCASQFYSGAEHSHWFDVVWFNYTDKMAASLKKGSSVYVAGTFDDDLETGPDGQTRVRRSISCDFVTFNGGGRSDETTGGTQTNTTVEAPKPAKATEEMPKVKNTKTAKAEPAPTPATNEPDDSDLPF